MRRRVVIVLALTMLGVAPTVSAAQVVSLAPPPRTIADITAILDQQKPDPKITAKLRADADAEVPPGLSVQAVAQFLYRRGQARAQLGRTREAIADAEAAIRAGRGGDYVDVVSRYEQFLIRLLRTAGEYKRAIDLINMQLRNFSNKSQGRQFPLNLLMTGTYLSLGDVNRAESYVQRNKALLVEARSWRTFEMFRTSYLANIEEGNARVYAARGQYAEAEQSCHRGEAYQRDALVRSSEWPSASPREAFEWGIDWLIALEGRMKAQQGRVAEAETDVRRALLSRLAKVGKYHANTAEIVGMFAAVLIEQGRYQEAEKLIRTVVEIYQSLGYSIDSPPLVGANNQLASVLNLEGRWAEAAAVYALLDEATKSWEPARREQLLLSTEHIATLYNTNTLDAGIAAAERLVARQRSRFGEQHVDTALTEGLLAIGLARANRNMEALRQFHLAVPILMARSRETDDDDPTVSAARDQREQMVVEAYVTLLSRMGATADVDVPAESFRLIDTIRSRSVQRALSASGARAAAQNPALAALVRKEQDLEKQLGAQLALLNSVLALPPEQRDDKAVKEIQGEIDKLRAVRDAAKRELAVKFRDYASLVEPAPPTIEQVKNSLRPDETLVSVYLGRDNGFVWAIPKTGGVAFATIAGAIDTKVAKLREALAPEVDWVSDIPPFDVATAYELYELLLKPIEASWQGSKSLIVVANGALGELPLGLLPTAPSQVDIGAQPLFAGYRNVPWLARTHAVTMVPSAAALVTLRHLPTSSAERDKLIGFGDPYFNAEEAAEAEAELNAPVQVAASDTLDPSAVMTRAIPLKLRAAPHTEEVDKADLALLPRLPDTRLELTAMAMALDVDPAKTLYLGKEANEQNVETKDLSRYQIVAFATHGLVPGDVDGLTQPALALTAPDIAGVNGDGLLTIEKILALKLNADWVVLSACNTAAGAGAGAEAASGLGRAFFYAGSRAILVTNWSVHSASARELVSDLFRRQVADPAISRAEALQQAMMSMVDKGGYQDAKGNTSFAYAHPLFWAPYTIIGDGG
jgi:CHAT domain-containing protein